MSSKTRTTDKARLDWMEENQAGLNVSDNPRRPHIWVGSVAYYDPARHYYGKTYREVIDIAMKGENERNS